MKIYIYVLPIGYKETDFTGSAIAQTGEELLQVVADSQELCMRCLKSPTSRTIYRSFAGASVDLVEIPLSKLDTHEGLHTALKKNKSLQAHAPTD